MIEHVVLFRWKPGTPPDQIARAIQGLRGLRDKVPGILDLTCGENFSPRSQGFQCGLVVRFESREALEQYGPHPAHQDVVVNLLNPIREETIAVDYEVS